MFEMILYGIGFCLFTLGLQFTLHRLRKNGNKGNSTIWTGSSTVIIICVLGIATKNINYLAAIVGYVIADEIGKAAGWH